MRGQRLELCGNGWDPTVIWYHFMSLPEDGERHCLSRPRRDSFLVKEVGWTEWWVTEVLTGGNGLGAVAVVGLSSTLILLHTFFINIVVVTAFLSYCCFQQTLLISTWDLCILCSQRQRKRVVVLELFLAGLLNWRMPFLTHKYLCEASAWTTRAKNQSIWSQNTMNSILSNILFDSRAGQNKGNRAE